MLTSPEATRTRALRKANRMNYHAIQTSGRTWSDPCGCTEHSGKRAEQRGSSGGHQLNTSIGGASSRNICSISSEISHNGWANRERGCSNEQGIPIAKPFSMTPPQCDGANHSRNSDCEPCAASRLSRFLRACVISIYRTTRSRRHLSITHLSDSSFAKSSCLFSLISRWTRSSISRSCATRHQHGTPQSSCMITYLLFLPTKLLLLEAHALAGQLLR